MYKTNSLLTERQASDYMAVTVAALRKWRWQGRGPIHLKIGRLVRYRPEDIEQWLSSRPKGGERAA
jgi:predicted DNA-binding transcriptional regulator AlpA